MTRDLSPELSGLYHLTRSHERREHRTGFRIDDPTVGEPFADLCDASFARCDILRHRLPLRQRSFDLRTEHAIIPLGLIELLCCRGFLREEASGSIISPAGNCTLDLENAHLPGHFGGARSGGFLLREGLRPLESELRGIDDPDHRTSRQTSSLDRCEREKLTRRQRGDNNFICLECPVRVGFTVAIAGGQEWYDRGKDQLRQHATHQRTSIPRVVSRCARACDSSTP